MFALKRLLLLVGVVAIVVPAEAGSFDGYVTLNVGTNGMQSFATYTYTSGPYEPAPQRYEQYHVIVNGGADHSSSVKTNVWSHNLSSHVIPEVPNCYNARMTITVHTGAFSCCTEPEPYYREAGVICYQGPPAPVNEPSQPNAPTCDDPGQCSPLILNLGNGGYELTGIDDAVTFDIRGDGRPVRTSWTAKGAPMAFLALDRNANGVVDSGAELFGNATRLRNGAPAANGFGALAELDDSGDGALDARDRSWARLLLWTDLDHDGETGPSELRLLRNSDVASIGLEHHYTGRVDRHGNAFRYQGGLSLAGRGVRPLYDVWFLTAPLP